MKLDDDGSVDARGRGGDIAPTTGPRAMGSWIVLTLCTRWSCVFQYVVYAHRMTFMYKVDHHGGINIIHPARLREKVERYFPIHRHPDEDSRSGWRDGTKDGMNDGLTRTTAVFSRRRCGVDGGGA